MADEPELPFIPTLPRTPSPRVAHFMHAAAARLRTSFHIQYTGVVAPLLVGLGAFAVSVERYTLAYICFVVAGLWALIWLWTLPSGHISRRLDLIFRVAASLLRTGIIVIVCATAYFYAVQKELESDSGILVPAGDPMPPDTCGAPPDAFVMYWGNVVSFRFGATAFLHPSLKMGRAQILELSESAVAKEITITALQLFDDRGQILAAIDHNRIRLLNSAFRDRPDQSTLIIRDHLNREVLNIRYINKRAISIRGVFNYPGFPPVEFDNRGILVGGIGVGAACFVPKAPLPNLPGGLVKWGTKNGDIVLEP